MFRIVLISFIQLFAAIIFAQSYNMSNVNITSCTGIFYDSGGQSANYGAGENYTKTFFSANGNKIKFVFNSQDSPNLCRKSH